jgi:hypothetical protein
MKAILFIILLAYSSACSINLSSPNSAAAPNQNASNTTTQKPDEKAQPASTVTTPKNEPKPAAVNCPPVKRAGKRQIKSQSFPFNFKPFTNACFVTFASVEEMLDEKDVPRGSTFHIYQDGESVLDLPDAFDGQTACWIEGVAFKDLNGDGLTDIVLAGSCLGAKNSYPSNAIYVNNGEDFTTNAEANQKLENFKKLSEIEAFVKKNQGLFF